MAEEKPQLPLSISSSETRIDPQSNPSILARFHAGYFRISLGLCSQALLWKTLSAEPAGDAHALRRALFQVLPSTAFHLLWSLSLALLVSLTLLYLLRCLFHFRMAKQEFLHHVGVNYLFAPSISWLLVLQSSPFLRPGAAHYAALCCLFSLPVVALDVKIYGQWLTKGRRFLAAVANPTSQLSVVANLVCSKATAEAGWREGALFLFSLGMAHYLVLFVTLYQRLSAGQQLPAMLRPAFFLFIAAPSMGSLAWSSIYGTFDVTSKMLFFLSLFLFVALASRPALFKRSMQRFDIAWWAYPFPLSVLALASIEYAQEVRFGLAHVVMLLLLLLSVLVSLTLLLLTALNTPHFFLKDDPNITASPTRLGWLQQTPCPSAQ